MTQNLQDIKEQFKPKDPLKPSMWIHNETENKPVIKTNVAGRHSIASLAKLMSAMVLLDSPESMSEVVEITRTADDDEWIDNEYNHYKEPSEGWSPEERPFAYYIPKPKKYTRDELLKAMLCPGDNVAAEALVKSYPGGYEAIVKLMNQKAQQLGMTDTTFTSPHGCTHSDISSATDIRTMLLESLKYEKIKEYTVLKKEKFYFLELPNLNVDLLSEFDNIILSKTGFFEYGGYHMALAIEHKNTLYSLIVLNAPTWDQRNRIVRRLIYNLITRE